MTHNDRNIVFELGYFINFELWKEAINLANFQIEQKQFNKHYNTLNLIYFEEIINNYEDIIDDRDYFENRVINNLFYGLNDEFFAYEYAIPKTYFGIRKYYFFSYPLRIVHFSIGLYLLKLSQEFISSFIKSNKHIKSFYGGDLKFQNDKLVLKSEDIYYRPHYKKYKRVLNNEIENSENKVAVRLDIENYFDNLSLKKLLNFLDDGIKHSVKMELKFDTSTMELINFFYKYITGSEKGIPQSDNNIISSFIGYLYLCFADLLIDDEINETIDEVEQYKIIRYMDDIFIILEFSNNKSEDFKNLHTFELASSISDLLYEKFDLRVNGKTKLFMLDKEEDKEKFNKELKSVSSSYRLKSKKIKSDEENIEDNTEDENHPQTKLNDIFEELEALKDLSSNIELYKEESPIEDEVFKEIYNDSVRNIANKSENIETLREIFSDFNFDLIKIRPKEILLLILSDEEVTNRLVDYFLDKENLTINDINLIIKFICQTDDNDCELFDKLKNEDKINKIINLIDEPEVCINEPGYYDLNYSRTSLIQEKTSIIKQIELRELSEKKENYSVALNHLVNELHAICFYYEKEKNCEAVDIKKYDANDVKSLLEEEGVANRVVIQIKNLFDRRNNNGISHSGTDDIMFSGVLRKEYFKFKGFVKASLNNLL